MKKSLLSLAVLSAVSFGAYADGVELYGILDLAVGTIAHQANGDGSFPATVNPVSATKITITTNFQGMMNGGIQDSRWGIKGSEDLGDGMKAIFTLESGIDANSGQLNNGIQALNDGGNNAANTSLNGQLFNRQAWVGLSDSQLGKLTFGRQYAQGYDLFAKYDPVQFAQLFSPLGFSGGFGGGMGISENLRQDNSVKYQNQSGNLKYGAMYKFGNQAGSTTFGQGMGLNFDYTMGDFSIGGVYQVYKDALKTSASAPSSVSLEAFNTKGYAVSVMYKLNQNAKVEAGIERYVLQNASDIIGQAAGTGITQVITSDFGYPAASSTGTNSYIGSDQGINIVFFGGDINVTDKLNLAAGYYHVSFDSYTNLTSAAGASSSLIPSGNASYVSLLADYNFSKRTDAYAGLMVANYDGAQSSSLTSSALYNGNNSIVAVGLRHKF